MMYAAKKIHELGGEEKMEKEQYDKYSNYYERIRASVIAAYNGVDRRRFRVEAEHYNARVLKYNGELERKSSSLHKDFKVSEYDIEGKMPPEIDSLPLEEALEKKIWEQYERDYPSGLPRKPNDQLEWEISAGF